MIQLSVGTSVKIINGPYLGEIGIVTNIKPTQVVIQNNKAKFFVVRKEWVELVETHVPQNPTLNQATKCVKIEMTFPGGIVLQATGNDADKLHSWWSLCEATSYGVGRVYAGPLLKPKS